MNTRDEVLKNIRSIPALPGGAVRVLQLLEDPNVDIRVVTRAAAYDPALSANLLRVANSAAWGAERTIATLEGAVNRLGLTRVYQAVVASIVGPMSKMPVRGYDIPAGELWNHAIAVATATREIVKELRLPGHEEAFTAGLLHDVGKIVLGSVMAEDGDTVADLATREGISFLEAEVRVIGIDHAEAGALLLEHWHLPPALTLAVREHHLPATASLTTDLVHLADMLCLSLGIGAGRDGLQYTLSSAVVDRLSLSGRPMERILSRLLEPYAAAREAFSGSRS